MKRPEVEPGEVIYPESDGKPMAETDRHRDLMFDLIAAARYRFRDVPDFYVSGNLFVYYEEGDPRKCVAPDFFAVRGVPKGRRRTFKVWEEGQGPQVVVELTSTRTHGEDLGEKRDIYEEIGVLEYFLFDPEGIRFQPQLQGFRLEDGVFVPVAAHRDPQGALHFSSAVLGLDLRARGDTLRLVDPVSGEEIPILDDFVEGFETQTRRADLAVRRADLAERQADVAERRAKLAESKAEAAEREARRLAQEIDRLRGERNRP